jgi:hypothetical protein
VSGLYAWDEDTPGAEIAQTKGKATPMLGTVQERLIRLWASPQGGPKAAVAGTTETFWLGANPGTLFADGLTKVDQTPVSWASGKPVVTFPISAVPGTTATATLDANYMTESVVVTMGSTTWDFTYDSTWLGRGGFFHSDQMHVVERFRRQGDVILYDVTVEDPEVLAEPWVLPTRTLRRNPNPDAGLLHERGNCEVYEAGSISSQIRH